MANESVLVSANEQAAEVKEMRLKSTQSTPEMESLSSLLHQMQHAFHHMDHDLHAVEEKIHERVMELTLESKKWEIEVRDVEKDVRDLEKEIEEKARSLKVMKEMHAEEVEKLGHALHIEHKKQEKEE